MGLIGIDLFTPSDVVERKNTRRVCMCVRSFSKKARSVSINVSKFHDISHNLYILFCIFVLMWKMWWQVPDFDIVTCMVAMPKDMVGCIRRSIELSQSINVDSSGQQLQKPASRKSSQVCRLLCKCYLCFVHVSTKSFCYFYRSRIVLL